MTTHVRTSLVLNVQQFTIKVSEIICSIYSAQMLLGTSNFFWCCGPGSHLFSELSELRIIMAAFEKTASFL
jgi:hypothetical protein